MGNLDIRLVMSGGAESHKGIDPIGILSTAPQGAHHGLATDGMPAARAPTHNRHGIGTDPRPSIAGRIAERLRGSIKRFPAHAVIINEGDDAGSPYITGFNLYG